MGFTKSFGSTASPWKPAPSPVKPQLSVLKQWQFQRNLLIYFASQHGWSQRRLAHIFDLPRSRIGSIVKEMRALKNQRRAGFKPAPANESSDDAPKRSDALL